MQQATKEPKRPRSAYNFYQLSFLSEGKKARHTQHAAKEVSKSWRKLSAEEKKPFMSMANFDQQRYMREVEQFEEFLTGKRASSVQHESSVPPKNPPQTPSMYNQGSFFPVQGAAPSQPTAHHYNVNVPGPVPSYRLPSGLGHHPSVATPAQRIGISSPFSNQNRAGISSMISQQQVMNPNTGSNSNVRGLRTQATMKRYTNSVSSQDSKNTQNRSSSAGIPPYLQNPKPLLRAAINQRTIQLNDIMTNGAPINLHKVDSLVREINECRDQLVQCGTDDFEAVVLSMKGTRKMRQVNIPSILISFTALTFIPVPELTGCVFEVELGWKRPSELGEIRCSMRGAIAMGCGMRAELILGTLRPISANAGMRINIRFVRYIRTCSLKDSIESMKNQIKLDLWSMGLYQFKNQPKSQHSSKYNHPLAGKEQKAPVPPLVQSPMIKPQETHVVSSEDGLLKRPSPAVESEPEPKKRRSTSTDERIEIVQKNPSTIKTRKKLAPLNPKDLLENEKKTSAEETLKCCECGAIVEKGVDLFEIASHEVCCSQECRDMKEKELLDAFMSNLF
mmetsp:Transcript_13521/g.20297  ORF Transcript_13521/g.20297 Transcript_13521/m.20297 type:complete len:563 (-) Transcript_13521:122-1810(-)